LIGESARTYQKSAAPVGLRADDAHRRALGVGAHDAERAGGEADVGTARDHGLLRLPAPLGVEQLQLEPVLLEEAGARAELRHGRVPIALLADGELQFVLGGGGATGDGDKHGGQHGKGRYR
jgi:hypothetical protein